MLYEIANAVAHPDHTVTITWADGTRCVVDFTAFIARGELFGALQNPEYFVREMSVLHGGIGLSWPNEVDFSADGLRQDAFPAKATLAKVRPFDKNTAGEPADLIPADRDGH
jgi:hypothetical protein